MKQTVHWHRLPYVAFVSQTSVALSATQRAVKISTNRTDRGAKKLMLHSFGFTSVRVRRFIPKKKQCTTSECVMWFGGRLGTVIHWQNGVVCLPFQYG